MADLEQALAKLAEALDGIENNNADTELTRQTRRALIGQHLNTAVSMFSIASAEVGRLQRQLEKATYFAVERKKLTTALIPRLRDAEATVAQLRQALEDARTWIASDVMIARQPDTWSGATVDVGEELLERIDAALAGSVPDTDTDSECGA